MQEAEFDDSSCPFQLYNFVGYWKDFFYKIIMYANNCFQGKEKHQMPLDNNCNNCRTSLLINFVLHSMKNKKTNEGDY